mmetsp:Transcript_438/g.687  ORF Transcript_438/g.687 Transcript_438/m.687 type:complete len:132 (-) Transcript_438:164-559(-)
MEPAARQPGKQEDAITTEQTTVTVDEGDSLDDSDPSASVLQDWAWEAQEHIRNVGVGTSIVNLATALGLRTRCIGETAGGTLLNLAMAPTDTARKFGDAIVRVETMTVRLASRSLELLFTTMRNWRSTGED